MMVFIESKDHFEKYVRTHGPEIVLHEIIEFVSNGKDLITFCHEKNFSYGRVISWIHANEERSEKFRNISLTKDDRIKELMKRAISDVLELDIKKIFDKKGELLPISEWPSEITRCITSINQTPRGFSIKFIDKSKLFSFLGKKTQEVKEIKSLEKLVTQSYIDDAGSQSDYEK